MQRTKEIFMELREKEEMSFEEEFLNTEFNNKNKKNGKANKNSNGVKSSKITKK